MNKPKCRYIYNPVQIAECGGPCEQGPEHCDCGELWVTETGGPADEELILTYAFAVAEAVNAMCKPLKPEDYKYAQLAGLRAVLARWGNHPESPDSSTLQPVPDPVAWMYQGEPSFDGTDWRETWEVTTDKRLAEFKATPDQPIPLFSIQLQPQ